MAAAYYNEWDAFAAEWLGNLSAAGHIAPGRVDARSIKEVDPASVGNGQAHFFAGIGGWSYALRLAGWPDDVPVWTGSCPCQPFSQAGAGGGISDERHLWPDFFRLIQERRPGVVFGEQVSSPDGLAWFDVVQADLEGAGYACRALDICAAGIGAPHLRQRLWFVGIREDLCPSGMADDDDAGLREFWRARLRPVGDAPQRDDADGRGEDGNGADSPMGDAGLDRDREHARELPRDEGQHEVGSANGDHTPVTASAADPWRDPAWIWCTDGKWRPVGRRTAQLGAQPMADGLPGGMGAVCSDIIHPLSQGEVARVGKLRGYGNAIVPQAAAIFIRVVMEYLCDYK